MRLSSRADNLGLRSNSGVFKCVSVCVRAHACVHAYVHEVQDFGYCHSFANPKCQWLDNCWRRRLSPLSFPDCVACDFHCRKEVFL